MVAEIVRLLGDREVRRAAVECDVPLRRLEQARNQAQQRGFSGAIAAGQGERLARRGGEIEAGEHRPPSPDTGEILARQPHRQPPKRGFRVWCGRRPVRRCGEAMFTTLVLMAEIRESPYKATH